MMSATVLGWRRETRTESQRSAGREGGLRGLVSSAFEIAEDRMTVRVSIRAPLNGMRARPRRVVPLPSIPNHLATRSAVRAHGARPMRGSIANQRMRAASFLRFTWRCLSSTTIINGLLAQVAISTHGLTRPHPNRQTGSTVIVSRSSETATIR